VSPGVAVRLLLAIIQREHLCRVEVPNTESRGGTDRPRE
jgi:hypothetical protein